MIDINTYIIILIVFCANFIRFSRDEKKLFKIRTILFYILLLRLIIYDPMLGPSIKAILSSADLIIFSLSSIVILLFFIIILYRTTRHISNYNPFLMLLSFLAGILSTRIVTDIYMVFDNFTILNIQFMSQILGLRYALSDSLLINQLSILIFSIFIGICEEFSKYFLFFAVIYFLAEDKDKFNIILYICCVALGFSLIENIHYSLEYGHYIRVMRNVFAGHMLFGIFMGYLTFKAYSSLSPYKKVFYICYSFLFAVLLHATWNFLAFVSMFNNTANIIFYIIYIIFSISGFVIVFILK